MWATLKKFLWEWRGVWITAPTITAVILLMRAGCFLMLWELAIFDQYLRSRPPEPMDDRVVIVGISEADVPECCFIESDQLAGLINQLKAQQPRAISVAIHGHLLGQRGRQELVQVIDATPSMIMLKQVGSRDRSETMTPPDDLDTQMPIGAMELLRDADTRVRRGLLYTTLQNGETINSLSLSLALRYLQAEGIRPKPLGNMRFQLGKAIFEPLGADHGGYIDLKRKGYELILNYRSPSQPFPMVSMSDVINRRIPADWGRDRIILIGANLESFDDLALTPFSGGLHSNPEPMPVMQIHANFTSQIISAALNNRPLIKSWSEPFDWVWIFLWSSVGASLAWNLRYSGGTQRSLLRVSLTALFAALTLLGSTYLAFLDGWWLPVVPPFLGLAGSAIAITIYIAHSAGQIRKTFGRYLSDEIVATLLESHQATQLGGERRTITILTSDLRGFTATSERLSPEEVVKVLNFYLEYMADVITAYNGTIDEFMGDGILVLFGAPTVREDDAERAVACAIAMQLAMIPVNEKMEYWDLPPLEMGIGIHTGEVVVGNIGSEKRTKYGIVGSEVNLTYRIESCTFGGQILISEETLKAAGSRVYITAEHKASFKGVPRSFILYDVGGVGGKYNVFLPKYTEEYRSLPEILPLQYSLLEGKQINQNSALGSLIKLSENGAILQVDSETEASEIHPLDNLKINLLPPFVPTEQSEDIYAKVLKLGEESGQFYLVFTAKPPSIQAKFDEIYHQIQDS